MGSVSARLSDRLLRSSSAWRPRVSSSVPMSAGPGTAWAQGGDLGPSKPHCAALTLGHLVQQNSDLLVLQQPALEEGDEDTVGEFALLAQLVGFGVRASVGMGRVG